MNLRKDNNGKALNAWKKLGPGLIEKPLRHIRNRSASKTPKGEIVYKGIFYLASWQAKLGNGALVQRIARQMP